MKIKLSFMFLALFLWVGTAFAGPPSLLGGGSMSSGTAHQVGVGWPSLFYEWWHSGTPDWAIGGELVYGDWSGKYSDMKIAGAINVPFRWHMNKIGAADVAFQVKPGILLGSMEGWRDDHFVFGMRGEISLPITIEIDPKVNLITGGAIPFTYLVVNDAKDAFVFPILARIGVEVKATDTITPWLLFELGPAMAFGDFDTQADFAFRIWAGSAFW